MSGGRVPAGVVLALVLALAAAAGAGCASDEATRDGAGRITEAGPVSVFDLQPGDCLPLSDGTATEVETVDAVPCAEPHVREVFAVVDYGDGPGGSSEDSAFPGGDVLTTFADAACTDRFADYVGVDYLESSLFVTYLLPNLQGWDQGKDRSVVCLVTTTGVPMTGSAKGTGR